MTRFATTLVGVLVMGMFVLAQQAERKKAWNFDGDRTAGPPLGFNVELGEWQVVVDPAAPSGKNVLAQTAKSSRTVFNLALVREPSFGDVDVSVKLRPVAGEVDQGGGVVWRARDKRNYYVARYNPLEGNFRVYKVEDGKRIQLGTAEVEAAEGWRTLRATMKGDHIECYLDGKKHLDVKDGLFREPGLIGLWTKADARTHFDDLAALLPLAPPPVGEAGKKKE